MTTNTAELLRDVREFARNSHSFPGGYPKTLLMSDGAVLCGDCARNEYKLISADTRADIRGCWQAVAIDLHMEGAPIGCDHCGTQIESAYGEDE